MIDLYLIRHAECENNVVSDEIIGGRSSESPLTGKGVNQAYSLGVALFKNGINFSVIHSSSAIRAYDTAKIVCDHPGFSTEITVSKELEELYQGRWEGKSRSECYTPKVLEAIRKDELGFAAPNGESKQDVAIRVSNYISKNILETDTERYKRVAVFTHGFCIKAFLYHIMEFKPFYMYNMSIDNASFTRLIYDKATWKIESINQVVWK